MKPTSQAVLGFLLLVSPLFGQSAQTLILPQVVDGGGWQSVIVLTNMTANTASASLTFNKDTTGGGTQPWTPPFLEVSSTAGLVLAPGSSMFLHTPGTSAAVSQGWGQVNADAGIVGYVIFSLIGLPEQDATAPAVAASNDVLVPYDDSNGFATQIAIVNPNSSPVDVAVGFRTTTGGVALNNLPTLPPFGHLAFALATQFPVIAGHLGLAEFYSATGNLSLIALRSNPTHSFTAAPAFFQSGPPLIAVPAVTAPSDPGIPYDPGNPYGYFSSVPAAGDH
jgi:hypothetical protein